MSEAIEEIRPAHPEAARQLHLARSYIHDASDLIPDVQAAHEELERQTAGGTAKGSLSAGLRTGGLESRFDRTLDLALEAIDKADALDPNADVSTDEAEINARFLRAKAYAVKGQLKLAIERWADAIAAFSESLKYLPNEPSTHFNLGLAYTNASNPQAAQDALRRAIEIDPTGQCGIDAAKLASQIERGEVGHKVFRGSWKVMGVLLGLALLSMFAHVWLFVVAGLAGAGAYFYFKFK